MTKPEHPAAITAAQIEQMMTEMQYFIDHPRIQQRRWVERGRTWLLVLQQARAHLLTQAASQDSQQ